MVNEPKNGTDLSLIEKGPPKLNGNWNNRRELIRNIKDFDEYCRSFNIDTDTETCDWYVKTYSFPHLLAHQEFEDGIVRFDVVTFDEAVSLIMACRPDQTGVRGMNVQELIQVFSDHEFKDKNGMSILCNDNFRALVRLAKGGLIP